MRPNERRIKIYLETTILNFYYAYDSPEWQKKVREFFQMTQADNKYKIFISDLVLEEIEEAPKEKARMLQRLIKKYNIANLTVNEKILKLAQCYIKAKIIPIKFDADAKHIAIATFYKMDAILSLNFQHIVKLKTIKECNIINAREHFASINIITPDQIIYETE